jgi:uncharacterized protein (DUF427 family)
VNDYPAVITTVNHVEPVPRRIRAVLAGETVVDTTRALYVWESPNFPQYYIPLGDVRADILHPEGTKLHTSRGDVVVHALRAGAVQRPHAAKVLEESALAELSGTVRFEWSALDAWFEEDEEVFVHPRNPYTRVDALRSTRRVRVAIDGTVLGETSAPVLVFETGLPTRYYLNPTEVDFSHLVRSGTVTACPYKGTTTGYWSVDAGGHVLSDCAWTYGSPRRDVLPIAGLIAFYNEMVDIFLDGRQLPRPTTHVSHPTH